jgi:hypothetical protein
VRNPSPRIKLWINNRWPLSSLLHIGLEEEISGDPRVFAENIDRFIQHGSIPEGSNPSLRMMAFGETNGLTQQAISDIEAYLLRLNGVDRSQIAHPGLQPLPFFYLTLVVFGLVGLVLAGLGIRMQVRRTKNLD